MHTFRAPTSSSNQNQASASSSRQTRTENIPASSRPRSKQKGNLGGPVVHHGSDDEDEDDLLPHPVGDGEGGYSYANDDTGSSIPLVSKHAVEDDGDVIFDGDEEIGGQDAEDGELQVVPYAHRDLKPGYVASVEKHIFSHFCSLQKCHDS